MYRILLGALLVFPACLPAADPPSSLKVVTQYGYLPQIPVLVRVEALDATGHRDRDLWDAEAILSADVPGISLSTNRVTMRNGIGSALVTFTGGGDFNLSATLGSLSASRPLKTLAGTPVTSASGTLPGTSTTWSGVINVTGDVTVPVGHTLTIQSNTLVLVNGVASGTTAPDIFVNGTIMSLGTEQQPVTITCADGALRWGQIRHSSAQPSVYRYTIITRGGRATGEGHTGTAPVIRPENSKVTFEGCSITDQAETSRSSPDIGTPGKVMYAINAILTFNDCLLGRSRMGPEIQGTALLFTNSCLMDMYGPDDADGIYLHDQQAGQQLKITDSVIASGDDDGIDTLGSIVMVENTIIRDWVKTTEDAKGISVFNGETHVSRCLIVNCLVGISAKWSSGPATFVTINNCTIGGISNSVAASLKANAPGPFIDFRITNSIIFGIDALKTDFGPTNFTVRYCDISEPWPGTGNITSDPLFVNLAANDYHLQPGSPCINTGDPASPPDPDGSPADMGVYPGTANLSVALISPTDGSIIPGPTNITLTATASSTGSVARVEFFQGSTKLGEDLTNPYSLVWSNVGIGTYTLTAVATDNGGSKATSAPVNISIASGGGPTTNTFIALGSIWKYLDNGSDQGTAWRALGFNDGSWASGLAELGYGDGDEATVVGFGPNSANKYVTTYFRRNFTVQDPARVQNLILNLLRDDGAVVFINGQEVFRISMPTGTINYQTLATSATDYPFVNANLPTNALIAGNNVLAAEVHQGNVTSTDLSFDVELKAVISAPANLPPFVSISDPPNGSTFAAPANVMITAPASDFDDSVTNVAFFANAVKLGDDAGNPFTMAWNNVAAGNYALTAVASDNAGLSSTSSVVNVTVTTNTAPPVIANQSPAPGTVTNLTQITVTFSKPVVAVDAGDLLINGVAAANVSGSGAVYTFDFTQPAYGIVSVSWAAGHEITDDFTPPHAFDASSAGATWQYQSIDTVPPVVATINPVPGSTVASLTSVSVTFDESVTGLSASDLLVNSFPATGLSGSGAGPYTFGFVQPGQGTVQLHWAADHGIRDSAGNNFAGGSWSCVLDTNATGVIISEIMYHPSSENILEEYLELFNKGAGPVNLNGWKFSAGVQFTFTNATIPAGGYLVVAADVNTFANKYPNVLNVVGNWTGFLNNSSEDIDLDDAAGQRVDSVHYADEGDWGIRQRGVLDLGHRGWDWLAEHDGLGKSLELINPNLSNNNGQNWAASITTNGTPGGVNSVFSNNIAPMILEATHFPLIPKSTDSVLVAARIVDESPSGLSVTLFYRVDSPTPPPFTSTSLHDDGLNGDAVAGDGLYSAVLSSQPNNNVVEWYISATDQLGSARTWPAPAIAAADGAGPTGQVVNALYQVDDLAYAGSQPLYKLIMTEAERAELAGIPAISTGQGPNATMNGTFISMDGAGTELHYQVGIRNRGHGTRRANPPNYRVNFHADDPWKGVTAINLNAANVHVQHFGSVVALKAGVPGANTVAVQVRVNNANLAVSGAPMYGSYAANEVQGGDFAARHFPLDPNGNIYRTIRDIVPPDFAYRTFQAYPTLYGPEDKNSYTNTWFKESNASEDDWTDLIGLLRVMGLNNSTPFTTGNVRQVANVEEWMRHLALMNLFGNNETGLNTGYNDDYYMYRGVNDPRFLLTYYDLDTILGQGNSLGPTVGLFTATQNNGSGLAFDRLLHWPDFEPIYYRMLKELLDTAFSATTFNALIDQTLASYVPASVITDIKNWMDQRRSFVLAALPSVTVSNTPVATITGTPRSPTPLNSAALTVGGQGVTSYRFKLNTGVYGAETPVATAIVVTGLANGSNTVCVIGKNAAGVWQDQTNATIRVWVVDTAWPAIRLNEVLARNDSAVNHNNTFPDVIELFNESNTSIDLSGLRLTDDPANPSKFIFPSGTALPASGYLVVYADNTNGTSGLHLGFSLDQTGEGVYLFDRVANGDVLLDSVVFGVQLPDLSVGRVVGGDWVLTSPTFGSANAARSLGNPRNLKINEWLAIGQSPNPDDFIELFNPDPLPVALGGLHLTDQPIGAPALHPIAPLSFIAGNGFTTFIADGSPKRGADHVNFRLALEQGEIGLVASDLSIIDCVIYGPQQPGISTGRCPDGALKQVALTLPTPGSPNTCPPVPPQPVTVSLLTISNVWRYNQSGIDQGTAWRATNFNDSAWASGPALLAYETCNNNCLPEPIRTTLTTNSSRITFYFRAHFIVPANASITSLEYRHVIDDGAVIYLNGTEVARTDMPAGSITSTTLASATVNDATYQGPFTLSTAGLVPGDNLVAVEVHQSAANSTDVAFGLELNGLIVTNNPVVAGVVINEVLANNATLEEADGSKPDWIELYNPSNSAVDVAGMSLTDATTDPRRWSFPAPSIIPALGFLKVRLDSGAPASSTNTGFGLKANGGSVYLITRPGDGGGVASSVSYGLQAADWSIGRIPDGSANWVLTLPTFGAANIAATPGNPLYLKINEWMANPPSGGDWFELFNPNPQPANISGFYLSNDLLNRTLNQLPALSFIGNGPYGYQRFEADKPATFQGVDHVNFKLSASGDALAISTASGAPIDSVSFGPQQSGVSQGRLTDGTANIVSFATTPTPGKSNFLPLDNVVVNELLSHTDPPLEDAVEFYNPSGDDVDISGWYLSDTQNNLFKYRVASNTVIRAGGYVVFYEYQFNTDHPGELFSFSSAHGDEVYLSQATAPGVLTGYRAFAEFGAAQNGVSFGRYLTSVGADFTAMSARTFGVDNPSTTNEFRLGTGANNAYPKIGPVVINEIMYHPLGTNDALEFIELHNILGTPVPMFDPTNSMNTWRLRKGVDFDFPPNITIPAGGYLVVVSFDPQNDPASLAAFRAAYGANMTLVGPYSGKLDNGGETVELQKPDPPQTLPGPDFGFVPHIVVDHVTYGDAAPWPTSPDGTGDSLKRIAASLYGNDPVNWSGGTPTPGAANFSGANNFAPVLGVIGNKAINEETLLTFTATAADADVPAQSLTFSLDAGAPQGASITPGGVFTWTPDESQGPGVYSITVRVTDSGSLVLSDFETISITVNEINSPPVLTPIGDKSVAAGTTVTFTASSIDSDEPVQTLIYSLDPGAPFGASITPNGVFTWPTTPADGSGTYLVTVRVTDNGSPTQSDTETISIAVVGAPQFNTPSISDDGTVTLVWDSSPGKHYRVQFSTDLTAGNWTNIGEVITATSATASFSEPVGNNQLRFYRVVLLD